MKQLGALLLPLDGMPVHHRVPSIKQLGVLLLPLDGMLVHHRVTISIFSGFISGCRYSSVHMGEERQCGVKFVILGNNMMVETRPQLFKG